MSVVFGNLSISNEILGSGMSIRRPVKVATTSNGSITTAFQNGSTVDGILLSTGDRILLKNQSSGIENGIYIVKSSGSPNRADDMGAGSLAVSVMILIEEGTVNADTSWMVINDTSAATVNSNALLFQQISGNGVDGDTYGPASSTDTAIARFSGTTGKNLQDSSVLLDGSGNLSGIGNITLTGTVDGRNIAGDAAHFTNTANPHSVTKAQIGLSEVPNVKANFVATTNPGSTDDSAAGYSVGSCWINVSADSSFVCVDDTTSAAVWTETTAGAGGGEANTASNVGTAGIGLFKGKVGSGLEFRNIAPASNKISVALDAGNNEVDIDLVEGNVNHDNLSGFVSNEHIDHSTVSVIAGEGITGGGTIESDRTLDIDVNGLTTDTNPDCTSDYIVTYDASAGNHKKVLLDHLPGVGNNEIFGSQYTFAEADAGASTSSTSFIQRLRLTTASIPAGDYRISWSWNCRATRASVDFRARVQVDDTTTIYNFRKEMKDSGNVQRESVSGYTKITLTAAVHNIDLDYCIDNSNETGYIYDAKLELYRVA